MSPPPPGLLLCPQCKGPLQEEAEGYRCPPCDREYPLEVGVVDLTPVELGHKTASTVKQFGDSWTEFDHMEAYHERQFLDWIAPLTPVDFQGKSILEAGCGKGRHSRAVSGWSPRALLSVDLSEAVYLAARHNADRPEASFVRANLLDLPLAEASFDLAFCVGVLHHLESPKSGLRELWRILAPGGTLCLWVYAREGNGWIVWMVDPLRKGLTSRLPVGLLKWLVRPLSGFLFLLLKGLYGPATSWGTKPSMWLPYATYLGKISPFPFREVDNIVLDHLCPPIAFYLRREELEEWLSELHAEEVRLRWHHRNSWTVLARKPR